MSENGAVVRPSDGRRRVDTSRDLLLRTDAGDLALVVRGDAREAGPFDQLFEMRTASVGLELRHVSDRENKTFDVVLAVLPLTSRRCVDRIDLVGREEADVDVAAELLA